MSFVHCPTCQRAYNLVGSPACPSCGVRAGAPADPTEDIILAADQLARAVARATPGQLAAAEVRLLARTSQLALPPADRPDYSAPPALLRAVRTALLPAPEPHKKTFTQKARTLLARLPSPRRIADRLPALASSLAEQLPASLADKTSGWSSRARALLARAR